MGDDECTANDDGREWGDVLFALNFFEPVVKS